MKIKTLISLGIVLSGATSFATEYLLVPRSLEGARSLNKFVKTKFVKAKTRHLEFVFAPHEQKALKELNKDGLVSSYRIDFLGSADSLTRLLREKAVDAAVEKNSVVRSQSLVDLQWGLKNSGQSVWLPLDGLTSKLLPAVAGEDLGVTRMPENAPAIRADKKIIVAVLDSGLDVNHPDLIDHVIRNPDKCALVPQYNKCVNVDKKTAAVCLTSALSQLPKNDNGYLDCTGWDTTENSPSMGDDIGHGTHVAGLIAASSSTGGTQGVAPGVFILPVRVIRTAVNPPVTPQSISDGTPDPLPSPQDAPGEDLADSVAKGILFAIRSNVNVIHMSLAWTLQAESPLTAQMIDLARSRGILVVSSAGNDSTFSRVVPCVYPGVLCVAASGPDGNLAHFSNYGSSVDISAPGVRILSTWPMIKKPKGYTAGYGYEYLSGTSMSAPLVSGALAQLLQRGFTDTEAVNRLLVSTRDIPAGSRKIKTGNADLAKATVAQPEPLIFPAEKAPILVFWDRKSPQITLSLSLVNRWIRSDSVKLHAQLFEAGTGQELSLNTNDVDLGGFDQSAQMNISFVAQFDPKKGDGRLTLKISAEALGGQTRTFEIPVEVSVPITDDLESDGVTHVPLLVSDGLIPLDPTASLRTIDHKDLTQTREYLAVSRHGANADAKIDLSLIVNEKIVAQNTVDDLGDLLLLQKLPDLYVVLSRPPQSGGTAAKPLFKFSFFDSSLKLKDSYQYNNQLSVISESFQWMKMSNAGLTSSYSPAWIGFGYLPTSEQAPYDPWGNTDAANGDEDKRFYYITADGPHTLKAPDNYFFVDVLSQALSNELGELRILLADDSGPIVKYAMARVKDAKITDVTPVTLPRYRRLTQVNNRMDVLSLDSQPLGQEAGTAFFNNSAAGALRMTGFTRDSLFDLKVEPEVEFDPILRPIGIFSGAANKATFSQTYYDLRYVEESGDMLETATTSLERFSFVPSLIFNRSFFPAVVSGKPAVFIPSAMGATFSMELIVPKYDESSALKGLSRPARYRLDPTEKCDSVDTLVPATETDPLRAAFYCGGRFLFVDLQ